MYANIPHAARQIPATGRVRQRAAYRFLNPLLIKRKREVLGSGRKRKTDPIDLRAVAHCYWYSFASGGRGQ